ncbi:MAG: hypothetical protein JNJ56_07550 [Ignavibacteria bacterium]|nr:hypothetical protein [Ignavibacteria bacterium]
MKFTYILLYAASGILFMFALLGSNLTKPFFTSVSEKMLDYTGFKKSYVQSVDNKIDDLIYQSKQIELQIEKIKNFFSTDKIDENKYARQKSEMLENSIYKPMVELFNTVIRISFIFTAFFVLMCAVIFHLIYRGYVLRDRIRRLEEIVYAGNTVQLR